MTDLPSPSTTAPWRRLAALGSLTLGLLLLLAWAFELGRPVALPEVGELRLPCVSYAPFRRQGHNPFDPGVNITPAMIEADLRLLASVSRCVRTYGVDRGLDAVPEIARQLGLRVILGAWIDSDSVSNTAQLKRALALTQEYADVIDLLVVGNEVLLRGEQTPAALADILAAARRESRVPVSYADVWEFWRQHAEVLRRNVDVVTIHILPYWEDAPVAVNQAVAHIVTVNAQIRSIFSPLPVMTGETGWPAAGRQRGAAVPGRLEQARFIRELLAYTVTSPLSGQQGAIPAFNLIEGFDQPWKRRLEGAMGGYWGIFEAEGQQRVVLSGPFVADPRWWKIPLAGLFGAIGGVLSGSGGQRRRQWRTVLGLSLAGAGIAALGLMQWHLLLQWNRHALDWVLGGGLSLAALISSLQASARLKTWLDGQPQNASTANWSTRLLLGFVVLTALGLLLDGRYRPLSWPLLAAPVALLFALRVLGEQPTHSSVERGLAILCTIAAPLLVWREGIDNVQALALAVNWLVLAMTVGWPSQRATPAS